MSDKPMSATTLRALRGSIRKWQSIVDGTGPDNGSNNCPLCQRYLATECKSCPVALRVGNTNCRGTPYSAWLRVKYGDDSRKRKRRAKAELDFLISLLPEGVSP